MRKNKKYTDRELLYLETSWGRVSVGHIASRLKRSECAIKTKAYKLGLGSPLDNRDFLIGKEVCELLGIDRKTLKKHIEKRGLISTTKILQNRKLIAVTYVDLIEWMTMNEKHWDGTKIDRLGLESIGLDVKIIEKKQRTDGLKLKRTTLTKKDKEKIKELYKRFITYQEIAKILDKEYSTIKWFIHTIIENGDVEKNTKNNRIVRTNSSAKCGWSEWQDNTLVSEFKRGKTLREISEIVGKSLSATKSRNQVLTKRIIKGMSI